MSDDAKPEHPAPWHWGESEVAILGENKGRQAVGLYADNHAPVMTLATNTHSYLRFVSPYVRELIRAAPEMKRLLWESPQEIPPGSWQEKVMALLAILDAARKAPR